MNKKQIQELIELVVENELTAIELEEKDTRIRIEKSVTYAQAPISHMPTITVDAAGAPAGGAVAPEIEDDFVGFEVKSPLVGVFYDANGPEEAPFVQIGTKVKEGDVLCIIESMKVMNEISTPQAGVIKKILVNKGDLVEFEQPLFIIE